MAAGAVSSRREMHVLGAGEARAAGFDPELRAWPGFALHEAARLVRQSSVTAVAAHIGLDWNAVAVLRVLASFPSGMALASLRDRTGLDRTTISELASDLEYDGHVLLDHDGRDGRRLGIVLTPSGTGIVAEARQALAEAERQALRRLDARERRRLHELAARSLPSIY